MQLGHKEEQQREIWSVSNKVELKQGRKPGEADKGDEASMIVYSHWEKSVRTPGNKPAVNFQNPSTRPDTRLTVDSSDAESPSQTQLLRQSCTRTRCRHSECAGNPFNGLGT